MPQRATAGGDLFTIGKRLQQQEHRMALDILNYLYRSTALTPSGMSREPLRSVPGLSARFRYGIALLALVIAAPAMACWNEAAQRYGVNPQLLYAIAKTESGLNPRALNCNPHQAQFSGGRPLAGQAGSLPQLPEQIRSRHNSPSTRPSVRQRRTKVLSDSCA